MSCTIFCCCCRFARDSRRRERVALGFVSAFTFPRHPKRTPRCFPFQSRKLRPRDAVSTASASLCACACPAADLPPFSPLASRPVASLAIFPDAGASACSVRVLRCRVVCLPRRSQNKKCSNIHPSFFGCNVDGKLR